MFATQTLLHPTGTMAKLFTLLEKCSPWCLLISLLYLQQISLSLIHNTKLSSWRNILLGVRNKIQRELLEKWSKRKTWQSYVYYGHTHTHTHTQKDQSIKRTMLTMRQATNVQGEDRTRSVLGSHNPYKSWVIVLKLVVGGRKQSGHTPESTTKINVWVGCPWGFGTGLTWLHHLKQ